MTKSELRNQLRELKDQIAESTTLDEMLELSKKIQSTIEEILKVPEPKLIDTVVRGKYTIELFYTINSQDWEVWKVKVTDNETGLLNEEMSDTVYMSIKAAYKFIESIKEVKPVKKQKVKKEVIIPTQQRTDVITNYAKVIYNGKNVIVSLQGNENIEVPFDKRKSWGHKKYVDMALDQTGVKLSYEFRYGWEIVS